MIHFIGIKGSGMSALACILKDLGHEVSGSDTTKYIFTEEAVKAKGIHIYKFDKNNIKAGMDVIIGNAFDSNNEEVFEALSRDKKDLNCYTYQQYIYKLMQRYTSISVAGSHGKTTSTGLMKTMLENENCGYLIGDGTGHLSNDSKYFVVESCEYQRHFMEYFPDLALITNVDLDHTDYYHSLEDYVSAFEDFANQAKKMVILNGDDKHLKNININKDHWYFGLAEDNDIIAKNVVLNSDHMTFDVYLKNEYFASFDLPFVGKHMLYNALGVISVGIYLNLEAKVIEKNLCSYPGAKRRFVITKANDCVYVDDYAHHPTEMQATIDAAKLRFPNQKIVAIYRPDRYSRYVTLMDGFSKVLNNCDEVCVLPFPSNATKEKDYDVDASYILKFLPKTHLIDENEEALKLLASFKPCVYLFMSPKDVYTFMNELIDFMK